MISLLQYGDREMAIGHNSKNVVNANSLSNSDRKKLKKIVQELNDSMTRIAAEKEFQKESIAAVSEEMGLDKKLLRRMAKTYFNATFNLEKEEQQSFEEFYELVINAKDESIVSPVPIVDSIPTIEDLK